MQSTWLEKEPRLAPPQIDPHHVANGILKSAIEPMRDIKVGMMSKVSTTVAKIAPSTGERSRHLWTSAGAVIAPR